MAEQDLPDKIEWCKFSSVAWNKAGTGFFYSKFPPPAALSKDGSNKSAGTELDAVAGEKKRTSLILRISSCVTRHVRTRQNTHQHRMLCMAWHVQAGIYLISLISHMKIACMV
jgi:hypothetical protein